MRRQLKAKERMLGANRWNTLWSPHKVGNSSCSQQPELRKPVQSLGRMPRRMLPDTEAKLVLQQASLPKLQSKLKGTKLCPQKLTAS